MLEVLFKTLSPIIGHMIKIANFLYEEVEIFIFCHVTYKLVENLDIHFDCG